MLSRKIIISYAPPKNIGGVFCAQKSPERSRQLDLHDTKRKKYWTGRVTLGYDLKGEQIRKSFSGFKRAAVVEKMNKAQGTIAVAGYVDKGEQTLSDHMGYWLYNIKAKK